MAGIEPHTKANANVTAGTNSPPHESIAQIVIAAANTQAIARQRSAGVETHLP
jgi:hypothetical protein